MRPMSQSWEVTTSVLFRANISCPSMVVLERWIANRILDYWHIHLPYLTNLLDTQFVLQMSVDQFHSLRVLELAEHKLCTLALTLVLKVKGGRSRSNVTKIWSFLGEVMSTADQQFFRLAEIHTQRDSSKRVQDKIPMAHQGVYKSS